MNKTTMRLAIIGGTVILGAFAIALAQNDARQREREQPAMEAFAPEEAVPIPAEVDDEWAPAGKALVSALVVRGNNDHLAAEDVPDTGDAQDATDAVSAGYQPTMNNPLRPAVGRSNQDSQVVLAGAGLPIEPAITGSATAAGDSSGSPPAWLAGSGSNSTATGPAGAADATGGGAVLPKLPTFPMSSPGASATNPPSTGSAEHLPSLAGALPSLPPTISSEVGDMSDTQRPAMAPTMLSPAPVTPASPFPAASISAAQSPAVQLPASAATSSAPTSQPASASPPSFGQFPPVDAAASVSSAAGANASRQAPTSGGGQSYLGGPTAGPHPAMPSSAPRSVAGLPQPARTAGLTELVSNQPGNRYLDGSQNPNMLIQKRAPEEIQVGKKATLVISVRNAGNATAHDVRVVDSVPQGSRFVEAVPAATPDPQGFLSWNLGEMAAGDERTITLQIVPEVQGEVGSNALVYFAAQASVRTVATLPKLELTVQNQPEILIGSRQTLSVVVKNSGTGVAREVRLEVDLPELLKHDIGEAQLSAPLGDLRPNDIRSIKLDLAAVGAGQSAIAFRATNDDGVLVEKVVAMQVLAPQLTASITGPTLRYLDRQATFVIEVSNNGTTAATNVDFIAHLPPGMRYVDSTQKGFYDVALHAVKWGLYELPVEKAAPIELTLLPVELGQQSLSFSASADLGLKAEAKHTVTVDGLAELAFTLGQDKRTIETGASSTYWVQITNVGNKPDKDVRLSVLLPTGAVLKDVNAQVKYHAEGNTIVFDPVLEMRNKDQHTYRFVVQHTQPGTQVVRTQLTSTNWPVAVIKEEGTMVYNENN